MDLNLSADFRMQLNRHWILAKGLKGIFDFNLSFVDFDPMLLMECVCDILAVPD